MEISSSQEILFSTQSSSLDDNNDYQLSTQEIISAKTQEAINATDFLLNLRDSQLNSSQESNKDIKPNRHQINIKSEKFVPEKKKRGRKRKIRTKDEMEKHLRDKKEKNRLAAQRLRQRKCSEIAKHESEVEKYEELVKTKKSFAQHLESKVNQLRNRIKGLFDHNNNNNNQTIQLIQINTNHIDCITR